MGNAPVTFSQLFSLVEVADQERMDSQAILHLGLPCASEEQSNRSIAERREQEARDETRVEKRKQAKRARDRGKRRQGNHPRLKPRPLKKVQLETHGVTP